MPDDEQKSKTGEPLSTKRLSLKKERVSPQEGTPRGLQAMARKRKRPRRRPRKRGKET